MRAGQLLPYARSDPPALRGQVIWVARPVDRGTLAVSLLWFAGTVLAAAFVAMIAAGMAGVPQALLQLSVVLLILISMLIAIRGRWALLRDEMLKYRHFRRLRQRQGSMGRKRYDGNRLSLALAGQWPRPRRIAVSMKEEDHWAQLRAVLDEANVRHARSIIDVSFAKRCRAIPLTEALLEPEDVTDAGDATERALHLAQTFVLSGAWIFAVLVIVVASACVPRTASVPGWLIGASVLGMAAGVAVGLKQLGRVRIVAGPGIITDARGRCWTSADSVMLISKWGGGMSIEFLGPAGRIGIDGSHLGPSGFECLWQRWQHPRPRPELWPRIVSSHAMAEERCEESQ